MAVVVMVAAAATAAAVAVAVDAEAAAVAESGDFYCDEVLSGKTPVEIVAESERALAYRHPEPAYPVHIVVISRLHTPTLTEVDEWGTHDELIRLVRDVALGVLRERGGCRVIANLGSYQQSEHVHWQVIAGEPGQGEPQP